MNGGGPSGGSAGCAADVLLGCFNGEALGGHSRRASRINGLHRQCADARKKREARYRRCAPRLLHRNPRGDEIAFGVEHVDNRALADGLFLAQPG